MEAFPIFSLFRLLLLFIFYSFKIHKTQIMQHKNKTVMVVSSGTLNATVP